MIVLLKLTKWFKFTTKLKNSCFRLSAHFHEKIFKKGTLIMCENISHKSPVIEQKYKAQFYYYYYYSY